MAKNNKAGDKRPATPKDKGTKTEVKNCQLPSSKRVPPPPKPKK